MRRLKGSMLQHPKSRPVGRGENKSRGVGRKPNTLFQWIYPGRDSKEISWSIRAIKTFILTGISGEILNRPPKKDKKVSWYIQKRNASFIYIPITLKINPYTPNPLTCKLVNRNSTLSNCKRPYRWSLMAAPVPQNETAGRTGPTKSLNATPWLRPFLENEIVPRVKSRWHLTRSPVVNFRP